MTIYRHHLISMLRQEPPSKDVQIAIEMLIDPETCTLGEQPTYELARTAKGTWQVRQQSMRHKGIIGYGIDRLIDKLEKVETHERVLGFGYRSPKFQGKFYIRERDRRLLGFVVVRY